MRRAPAAIAAAFPVVVVLAACSTSVADGPRKLICGEWIGRAETIIGSGPWYVDASHGSSPTITAASGSSGTWVKVSSSCDRGAQVPISDPAVVSVSNVVTAKDGADVAVLVSPRAAGRAVVTATETGFPRAVIFAITTPPSLPQPHHPDRRSLRLRAGRAGPNSGFNQEGGFHLGTP